MLFSRLLKNRFLPLFILLLAVGTYWGVWNGFFQQDEWSGFGRVIAANEAGIGSLIRFSGLHFTPLSILFVALFYQLFEHSHVPYGIYSVLAHTVNALLVYLLGARMTQNKHIGLLSGIIFAASYTPFQAVTWYAASLSILPTTFLALLGLLAFEEYIIKRNRSYFFVALLFIFLSAGFRENSIILLVYFLFRAPFAWRGLVTTGIIYLSIRFAPLLFTSKLTTVAPHVSRFMPIDIVYQAVSFVLFYLPRLFIPTPIPTWLGRMVFGQYADMLYYFILNFFYICVWVCIIYGFVRIPKTKLQQGLIVFILLSIVPFFLLPIPFIMESRHYYFSTIGFSILLGSIVYQFRKKWITNLLFSLLLIVNIFLIRQEITNVEHTSAIRIGFLKQWRELYPKINTKTIFLSVGDSVPFQSGYGQILLVDYHVSPLLNNYFLWGTHEQGYREAQGIGFGYFTDFQEMRTAYCKSSLNPTDVFAFSWDHTRNRITDKSKEYRSTLLCP